MPRLQASASLLLIAVLATACGSTAQAPGGVAVAGPEGATQAGRDGLSFDATAPQGDGLSTTADPLSVSGEAAGSGLTTFGETALTAPRAGQPAGSNSGQVGGPRAQSPSTFGAAGKDGIGVTAKDVFVGMTYTTGSEAAAGAFGADVKVGDTKSYIDAAVKYVNSTGGIRGRRLTPVFAQEDATSGENRDAQAQARCERFTVDNKVFAVLDSSPRESFLACVQKTAINVAGFESNGYSQAQFRRYRDFFDVNTLTVEQQYGALVPSLQRQNWFTGWNTAAGSSAPQVEPVLGVLSVDDQRFKPVTEKVLLPALAKAGHPVSKDNVVYLFSGNSTSETSRTITEIQSAVLRFRSNGVTHVVIFDNNGGVTLFFGQNAENQNYRPRYGITTANYVQALIEGGNLNPRQARGAAGLGYLPLIDLRPQDNPVDGPYSNATRRLCLDIYRKAGIDVSNFNARAVAFNFCDKILFFAHVARKVDGPLTRDAFRREVERLVTSYPTTALQVTRFDAAHHYGVGRGYDIRFDDGCTCQKYSRAFPLP